MFRFTIRDVLWLTVVAAMGVGWWLEHQQSAVLKSKAKQLQADLIVANHEVRSSAELITALLKNKSAGNVQPPP
jgi:hypothetical protein